MVTVGKVLRGKDYLLKVCEAFGIDPKFVHTVVITASVDNVVQVEIKRHGTDELLRLELTQKDGD